MLHFQGYIFQIIFPGHIPTHDHSEPLYLALQQQEDHVHGQVSQMFKLYIICRKLEVGGGLPQGPLLQSLL